MINIGEEKGAWLRIVSDLENELLLVRKFESEKDYTISTLKEEKKTLKDQLDKEKSKNEKLAAKVENNNNNNNSREGSRSGTPNPNDGSGSPVSRSQEIEAWMTICNSLSLSKPVFSGSGAIHSTTLKSVVDAIKNVRLKEVNKDKEIEFQKSKVKELEEKMEKLKNNSGNKRNAHFASGGGEESLPPGFSEEEYFASTTSSQQNNRSRSASGKVVGITHAQRLADQFFTSLVERLSSGLLSAVSEKVDYVCKSTSEAMGEPRWRGPKHADGARWVGTWDNVMAQDQEQMQNHGNGEMMMMNSNPNMMNNSRGAAAGNYPQAHHYYTSDQQQMMMPPSSQQQQQQRSSSSYNNNQRGSSPTNWRRVLDSHLGSSYQQQQQQQQNSHLYSSSNGRQIVNNNNSQHQQQNNSPFRGSPSSGHHNYAHPNQNRPSSNINHHHRSPQHNNHRSSSPLGASQTIRQILERMQQERSSFARSRSGSPQNGGDNGGVDARMYSGQNTQQYPFVNRAIRRSQSPPDHRGGPYRQEQQQQMQMQRGVGGGHHPPSNTRFVALPPNMPLMKAGGSRSLTPSGLRSSSAYSNNNHGGNFRFR